jgi:hypothetical protein
MFLIISDGALGKGYKTRAEVLEAWNANKDFVIRTVGVRGTYVSKSDLIGTDVTSVKIWFHGGMDYVVIGKTNQEIQVVANDDA